MNTAVTRKENLLNSARARKRVRNRIWQNRYIYLMVIPVLIYMILLMLIFGSNIYSVMLGICINGWTNMARIVRAQVMSLKEQEFAVAAFVTGADSRRIVPFGEVPSPIALPPGCPFAPRCRQERPSLRDVSGRQVACHHVT